MKHTHTLAFGIASLAATVIVLFIVRSAKTKRMLTQISDEGYETANDILFPGDKMKAKHLHYGPVIPS